MEFKTASICQGPLKFLDIFCLALSPMAILGFVIFLIIILSGLIGHISLINQYESEGRVTTAQVDYDADPDLDYLFLKYNDASGQVESGFVRTRYYKSETIAQYKAGQSIQVYHLPGQGEHEVIPVADFDEFRQYRGYWQGIWIPLLVSYLIVIIRPDWLYLGLVQRGGKH